MINWKAEFEQEMEQALQVRQRGNEGQARVRARRAAGIVAREYFRRQGMDKNNLSAIQLLGELLKISNLPGRARQAVEKLVLRVNEEFHLPAGVDLIAEARVLELELLPGSTL